MDVTREDVLRCARLTDLQLKEEEIEPLARDMARLLSHAEGLAELDLTDIAPMRHGLQHPLPWRDDEPRASLAQVEALANAPAQQNGHFLVPKVM